MSQIPGSPIPDPSLTAAEGGVHPHTPADDREEVYFEGSPPLRGHFGKVLLYGLIGIIVIAAPFVLSMRFKQPSPWWVKLICVVIGLIIVMIPVIIIKRTRYRVTNYRIDFERGWLSTTIDTLELWHVEDIKFHQSLWDKILGVGTIEIFSHDDTTPNLFMKGVPNARQLFATLQQRIIAVKRQRGVMKVDSGS
jgi:uncharacterized membrane protein YdbT with pleckstrin-like domain